MMRNIALALLVVCTGIIVGCCGDNCGHDHSGSSDTIPVMENIKRFQNTPEDMNDEVAIDEAVAPATEQVTNLPADKQ